MVELRKVNAFDYIRFVLSSLLLLFSTVVTFYAIIMQKTNFWDTIPGWAALILFLVDLFILGIMEGLQIGLVELKRQHPDSYKESHPAAYKLGRLAATGDNVERFLMGRQVFVVVLVFFAAKLTTIHLEPGEAFLFPTPYWFRAAFLESGILACVIVVIVAQLMPQINAAKFPVHFLQFLIMRPAYYVCIFVEFTGLTHACWLLSELFGFVCRMKDDVTTVNPNDLEHVAEVLQEEAEHKKSLPPPEISTIENGLKISPNANTKAVYQIPEKSVDATDEFSRFTHLVKKINCEIDPDTLRVLRHYLDTHPEQFHQFPSVIGSRVYPSPHEIGEQMKQQGCAVPKFLLDISDPEHVPPHIVAVELLAENHGLRQKLVEAQQQLGLLEEQLSGAHTNPAFQASPADL